MGWIAALIPLRLLSSPVVCADDSVARDLVRRGTIAIRSGDLERAAALFAEAVQNDALDGRKQAYLASALYMAGKFDAAEPHFLESIRLEPDNPHFRSNLGTMYIEWGPDRAADGLRVYEEAIRDTGDPGGDIRANVGAAWIMVQQEQVRRELRESAIGGGRRGQHYDLEGLWTGRNYTHKGELAFMGAITERVAHFGKTEVPIPDADDLLEAGITVLRGAVASEPRFAPAAHVLANAIWERQLRRRRDHKQQQQQQGHNDYDGFPSSADPPPPGPEASDTASLVEARDALQHSLGPPTLPPGGGGGGGSVRLHAAGVEEGGDKDGGRDVEDGGEGGRVGGGGGILQTSKPQLRVVTVASEEREELQALVWSGVSLELEVEVLGLGEAWQGLGQKVSLFLAHLQGYPPEEDDGLIMFVDAYDVLLLSAAREVADRFRGFGADIVFSAETASSPDAAMALLREGSEPEAGLLFPNSGTYMGTVQSVREMLEEVQRDIRDHHAFQGGASPEDLDDQRWFTRFFYRNQRDHRRVVLDRGGMLFHTLHGVNPSLLELGPGPGDLRSRMTGSRPCVIHGNGGATEVFRALTKQMMALGWPGGLESGMAGPGDAQASSS